MACTSCDGVCTGCTAGCQGSCEKTCNGCSGGCTGCYGSCTGSCTNGCNTSCTGSCKGSCNNACTGSCGSCTGTCTGYCDNACTSVNSAQTIANLGLNILQKGIVTNNDFLDLKTVLRNEFSRRSMTLPINDTYSVTPANGVTIYKEEATKIFGDINQMNSALNYSINASNVILTSDMNATIAYIQTLMSQSIRS
jgi:modification target Cys-rich repeat protein